MTRLWGGRPSNRGSIPRTRYFLFSKATRPVPGPWRLPIGAFFSAEYIGSVVNLTIRSHSVKRIRITGILSLLPSYAFLECTATAWPFNSNEQDRQCTYTVTLRCVREWKRNNYYIFCLSFTLRYPACNANAPFCHLLPAPLYNIFSHYLVNGTSFEKKGLLNIKYVLIFSTSFCLKHFSF